MIGLDTAKSVFQLHGIDESGKVQLGRKLCRSGLIPFFERQPRCTAAWKPAARRTIGPVCWVAWATM